VYDVLASNRPQKVKPEEAALVIRIIEAVFESSKHGRVVEL
jgi:predicted dehydrogenase